MPSINKSTICNNKVNEALSLNRQLDSIIKQAKVKHLTNLRKGLFSMEEMDSFSALDEVEKSVTEANEKMDQTAKDISEGVTESISVDESLKNITNCLGMELEAPSTDLPDAPKIPGGNIGQVVEDVANSVSDTASKTIENALSSAEDLAGKAASAIENTIPKDQISNLLDLVECLAECEGADGLPTSVNIENKLGSVGLNTESKLDFETEAFNSVSISESTKNQMSLIKDMQNSVKKASEKVKSAPVVL